MSANVRCTGKGWYEQNFQTKFGHPCGWKGKRGRFPEHPNPSPEVRRLYREQAMTEKPCPRCGGRVELIQGASA